MMGRQSIPVAAALLCCVSLGMTGACAEGEEAKTAALEQPPASVDAAAPASVYAAPPTAGLKPADSRSAYRAIIVREAAAAGVPAEVAEAVMAVESGYNAGAIGGDGEIGLMQILPSTARMLGFSGTLAALAVPETNIRYGVMYLAGAWRLAGRDLCTAAMKYRAGHGETRFSHLSVDYCIKVRAQLTARGIPVFGTVPEATFGQRVAGRAGRRGGGLKLAGGLDYNGLNARLQAMTAQALSGKLR